VAQGKTRAEVYYSGRVQGVGFRYSAREIAGRFAVSGYARNLSDGRVHLVVEGEADEVSRFLAAIASAFAGKITNVHVEHLAATSEFDGFSIRF